MEMGKKEQGLKNEIGLELFSFTWQNFGGWAIINMSLKLELFIIMASHASIHPLIEERVFCSKVIQY